MEAAAPGVSGHAAAGLRAPRPPVRAAAQQEAGRQGAEGEVAEVGAGGQPENAGHNNITWPLLVSPSTQLVALLRGPDCGVLHPPDEIPRGGVAVVVGVGAAQPAASRGLM